jgi:hypothetical protein
MNRKREVNQTAKRKGKSTNPLLKPKVGRAPIGPRPDDESAIGFYTDGSLAYGQEILMNCILTGRNVRADIVCGIPLPEKGVTILCSLCGKPKEVVPPNERYAVCEDKTHPMYGMPLHPEITYLGQGWSGWNDFLGTAECCDECGN